MRIGSRAVALRAAADRHVSGIKHDDCGSAGRSSLSPRGGGFRHHALPRAGLLRDVVLANLIGANGNADAFFVAFKIPNFLRRLFAEGHSRRLLCPYWPTRVSTAVRLR